MTDDEQQRRYLEDAVKKFYATKETVVAGHYATMAGIAISQANADAAIELCEKALELLPDYVRAEFQAPSAFASLREEKLQERLLKLETTDPNLAGEIQRIAETDPILQRLWK